MPKSFLLLFRVLFGFFVCCFFNFSGVEWPNQVKQPVSRTLRRVVVKILKSFCQPPATNQFNMFLKFFEDYKASFYNDRIDRNTKKTLQIALILRCNCQSDVHFTSKLLTPSGFIWTVSLHKSQNCPIFYVKRAKLTPGSFKPA